MIVVTGVLFAVSNFKATSARDEAVVPSSQGEDLRAELDLRDYTVSRSEGGKPEQALIRLARARLILAVYLPLGSEPGSYEIQILDGNLRVRTSTAAGAEIRNYITTIHASLDLRSLSPGKYKFALRRSGEEWRLYPAIIE